MPLPLAHALVGATVVAACLPADEPRKSRIVLAGGALAITPDFDFMGLVLTGSREWHRGFSHSLGFALLVGLVMLAFVGRQRLREVIALTAALMSHGLLDFVTTFGGGGIELAWPLTTARYKLGLFDLFEPYLDAQTLPGLLGQLAVTSLIELATFAPFLAVVLLIRRPRAV